MLVFLKRWGSRGFWLLGAFCFVVPYFFWFNHSSLFGGVWGGAVPVCVLAHRCYHSTGWSWNRTALGSAQRTWWICSQLQLWMQGRLSLRVVVFVLDGI
jgi:hypothetical protein